MFYLVYCTLGVVLSIHAQIVFSTPIAYDQRQTGDVNVQIHLKDVQVVALLDSGLLEDYVDYDYAYDYADFTLKPIAKPTTSTPPVSTSSVKPWNTWPTKPPTSTTPKSSTSKPEVSKLNTTKKEETTTISVSSEKTTDAPVEETSSASPSQEKTTISLSTQDSGENSQTESSKLNETDETTLSLRINIKNDNELIVSEDDDEKIVVSTTDEPPKKSCPAQYILDKKGRCRSLKSRRRVSLVPLAMRLGTRLAEKGNLNVRKDLPIRVYKSEPIQ